MSWLFSQALVAAYSPDTCLAGAPSVPSSLTPTQPVYWSPGKTTDTCPRFPSGMMCVPLTATSGEAVLALFLAGFPAKTFQSPAKAQESPGNALDYGKSLPESLAKYDPTSSMWKTHQRLLAGDWESYSETWPRWGTMRNGECWARDISGLGISVRDSGWWLPTIGKNEFKGTSKSRYRGSPDFHGAKMSEGLRTCEADPIYLSPSFAELAMGWPIMWTVLAPLAMANFRQWELSHGMPCAKTPPACSPTCPAIPAAGG